jgi:beta-1,4-N-acetylglucosaminyltransferase
VLGLKRITIVFVESICRVESLSLSGRIVYYFADHIVVQWPELKEKYPMTRYLGRLV